MGALAPGAGAVDEVLALSVGPGAVLEAHSGGYHLEALVRWLVLGCCVFADSQTWPQ